MQFRSHTPERVCVIVKAAWVVVGGMAGFECTCHGSSKRTNTLGVVRHGSYVLSIVFESENEVVYDYDMGC